ncbi:MAG: TPM domain-containing protein [Spirochaetaceae bacterium]
MKFTEKELEGINNAVKKAESTTSGEIATAIIKESSDYAFYELAFSVLVGAIYFIVIVLGSTGVESWLKSMFWNYDPAYLLMFTGLSLFLVIGITYVITNIPVVDRLIIPKKVIETKVYNRAIRHFLESGTCYTKDRTGILIFISEMERKVILLADKGINDKIHQESWDGIVKGITTGIKNKNINKSIIQAVDECGKILTKEFPIEPDDINELSDDIQVLEK